MARRTSKRNPRGGNEKPSEKITKSKAAGNSDSTESPHVDLKGVKKNRKQANKNPTNPSGRTIAKIAKETTQPTVCSSVVQDIPQPENLIAGNENCPPSQPPPEHPAEKDNFPPPSTETDLSKSRQRVIARLKESVARGERIVNYKLQSIANLENQVEEWKKNPRLDWQREARNMEELLTSLKISVARSKRLLLLSQEGLDRVYARRDYAIERKNKMLEQLKQQARAKALILA